MFMVFRLSSCNYGLKVVSIDSMIKSHPLPRLEVYFVNCNLCIFESHGTPSQAASHDHFFFFNSFGDLIQGFLKLRKKEKRKKNIVNSHNFDFTC